MTEVGVTLITVLGGIVSTLVGFLIRNYKKRRELERRNDQYRELCNYMAGLCDMICQPSIKVEPEVREAMKKCLKRYHKLDLVKAIEKEESED